MLDIRYRIAFFFSKQTVHSLPKVVTIPMHPKMVASHTLPTMYQISLHVCVPLIIWENRFNFSFTTTLAISKVGSLREAKWYKVTRMTLLLL